MRTLSFGQKAKRVLLEGVLYLAVLVLTSVIYALLDPYYSFLVAGGVAKGALGLALALVIGVVIFLQVKGKMDRKKWIITIMVIGFIMRLFYICYSDPHVRQHDTFSPNKDAHFDYAEIIYNTWRLPKTKVYPDTYQFYHPPLNAYLQAIFMKIWFTIGTFMNNTFGTYIDLDVVALYASTRILDVLYSVITMVFAAKTFKLLGLKDKGLFLAIAFIALYPRFIQLSGQLNNDMPCIMFSFLSLYYTVKWWQTKSWVSIMMIAIMVGLAMMSKLSGATICFPIAFVFILEFIKTLKTKEPRKIINICCQFVAFLAVCAPLGLWFQVYAYKVYGQPFAYVFDKLNPALSTADYSLFRRFLLPLDLNEDFGNLFCSPGYNYNLWVYLLRSSIFGEFNYYQGIMFAVLALILNYVLLFAGGVCVVLYLLKIRKEKDDDKDARLFYGVLVLSQVAAMFYFYYSAPYGCTMDFRYIVPILLGVGGFIGLSYNSLSNDTKKSPFAEALYYITLAFLLTSTIFYCCIV